MTGEATLPRESWLSLTQIHKATWNSSGQRPAFRVYHFHTRSVSVGFMTSTLKIEEARPTKPTPTSWS